MSGCGKRSFSSRAEAREYARQIAKAPRTYFSDDGGGSRDTRPYVCRDCGLWHLTSQTKREMRQIARKLGRR